MSYFEFDKHEYYALVAAESIEKAIDIYLEIVGHEEEKEVRAIKPTEISFCAAFKHYRSVRAKEDGLKYFFPTEYMETFEVMKNTAIVLDGAIS
ncbi:hypothetical protein [Bacillus arachidis]|uniref:Uncharacterized protein n=1 Tax=Bacillus arachidis TaxID=2819290 RepID=A0ABS3P5W0_9BACI|nr:hypothetical protein [Bacillus arachidis]MBO1628584.1 hypothetical protein [Bacillus arachidis]